MSSASQISVITPTYREAENLPLLIEAVDQALVAAGYTYELIVANDDSGDDTAPVCAQLESRFPLRLLSSKMRRGLSGAVVDGIKSARGEIIVVMDADLSHPPNKIAAMVEILLHKEADFVVGSRYAPGGSVDARWPWRRRFNSWAATLPAKFLTSLKDPMSGFFAFRSADMPAAEKISPIGYKIGLEILVKGEYDKARVKEVPIKFQDRRHGQSKLNLKEQFNYLRHLRRLYHFRWPKRMEIGQFCAVGGGGMLIDISVYLALRMVGTPHLAARAIAFWPAVSFNWFLNRKMTFKTRPHESHIKQWAKFSVASLFGFAFNWGTYAILTLNTTFFSEHLLLALLVGVLVGTVFNFISSDLLVFRQRR